MLNQIYNRMNEKNKEKILLPSGLRTMPPPNLGKPVSTELLLELIENKSIIIRLARIIDVGNNQKQAMVFEPRPKNRYVLTCEWSVKEDLAALEKWLAYSENPLFRIFIYCIEDTGRIMFKEDASSFDFIDWKKIDENSPAEA